MSNLNRRDWIKGVSAAGATMACGVRSEATTDAGHVQPATSTSLTLLHTNDLHGHLTAWRGWEGDLKDTTLGGAACLASAIGRVRAEVGDRVLLLDAGDLIGDTMIADRTQGAALIEVFNHLGYDALTLGNHEPDFGIETLRRRIADAQFNFVAANLSQVGRDDPFVPPYSVKSVAGLRVGILGLTYPKTSKTTAPKNVSGLAFEEPVAAAVRHLPALRRDGAELVIVLSHLGIDGDRRLATEVEGIDVIVGGHSHNRIATPHVINGTLILQAGAHGSDLGRLDLNVRNGGIESHRYQLIPLDQAKLPPNEATERFVADLCRPHRDALDEPIGTAADWLVRAQTLAGQEPRRRDEESPVDSLFADAIRQGLGVDFVFLPGVGYGVAIPPGPMTASQLRQLVPHDGALVTMRLSGAEVQEVLEQGLANVFADDPREKVGGMIQVSGLRFRYRPASRGERIVAVETEDGALNPTAEYRVATNAMLAAGGHNQRTLAAGRDVNRHGSQFEFLKTWMSAHSPVRTPERGRITKDV